MNDIVIIGSGGLASEVAFLIDEINKEKATWNILGYIVNENDNIQEDNGKYKVFNTDYWLLKRKSSISVVFGIGDVLLIPKLLEKFKSNREIQYPNLIHPNAIGDWPRIKLGVGNVICAGNVFTTNISIGSFNYFNLSCTIGHEVVIGDSNLMNPTSNISGGVKIGRSVQLGTGSQVLQYLNICDNVTVGAGAVVTKDIIDPGVYVGVPARRIK